MLVSENADGTFLVTFTVEERLVLDEGVKAGSLSGATPSAALTVVMAQMLVAVGNSVRTLFVEEVKGELPALTAGQLRDLRKRLRDDKDRVEIEIEVG